MYDDLQIIDIDHQDCRKNCLKGTLNAACDACLCDDHVLTGRVQTAKNAPIAGAKVALSETPYKALARTDDKGFFKALNVCADANQELLISTAGFVPIKTVATISSSKTANVQVKLQESGDCFIFFQLNASPNTLKLFSTWLDKFFSLGRTDYVGSKTFHKVYEQVLLD